MQISNKYDGLKTGSADRPTGKSPGGVGYMASLKKGSRTKYIQNLIKKLSGLKKIHSVDNSRIGALEF